MESFGALFKQIIDGVGAHQEDPQPDKEKTDKIRANIWKQEGNRSIKKGTDHTPTSKALHPQVKQVCHDSWKGDLDPIIV